MKVNRGATVDPSEYPHLYECQMLVDRMAEIIDEMRGCIPFHLLTWHRLRREHKECQRKWDEERRLHLEQHGHPR